jgi:CubicO group peptidase (beta-lactamase class C family)
LRIPESLRTLASTTILLAVVAAFADAQETSPGQRIDATIEALGEQGHFPGMAVAVMREGERVHVGDQIVEEVGQRRHRPTDGRRPIKACGACPSGVMRSSGLAGTTVRRRGPTG